MQRKKENGGEVNFLSPHQFSYGQFVLISLFSVQFGHTALYSSSKKGHVEVVQLLLKSYANTKICNEVHVCKSMTVYIASTE